MNQFNPSVLMFGWELPPFNSGGMGVACYGLAEGLVHYGVDLSFALPHQFPYNIPFLKILDHRAHGMNVFGINSLLRSYQTQSAYSIQYAKGFSDKISMYGRSIYEEAIRFGDIGAALAKNGHYHLVHSHDWMTYPAGMAAREATGIPFVAHVHATEFDRTGGSVDSRIADLEYQGLSKADKVITVSEYTKNIVHQYYSIPKDKIQVVHNGITPVEYTAADIKRVFPHDHIVLYVGRLTFQKGLEYFLRSAKKVLELHPNTIFIVAGDGDMFQRHILEAASLEISSRVIFTGFVTGDKLRSLYQIADVFVMPSVSEPYGLVVLEAIASGVPCIVSKQSGVIETVRNILTVDFWDVDKMAHQISTVLSFPKLSREMVLHAQDELKGLTWDHAARKTLSVYQSVLA